jgi:hypothetical protein
LSCPVLAGIGFVLLGREERTPETLVERRDEKGNLVERSDDTGNLGGQKRSMKSTTTFVERRGETQRW